MRLREIQFIFLVKIWPNCDEEAARHWLKENGFYSGLLI